MVGVGKVRMAVRERGVAVWMGVRLEQRPFVAVPMVPVVHMKMVVRKDFMGVKVAVLLS